MKHILRTHFPLLRQTHLALLAIILQLILFKINLHDISYLHWMVNNPLKVYPDIKWQFLHGSPLSIWILLLLGITSMNGIKILFLSLTCFALLILFFTSVLTCKKPSLVWLVCCSPLIHVLISWGGKSDPLLICGLLILSLTNRPSLKLTGIITMLLAHKELGLLLTIIYHFVFTTDNRQKWLAAIGVTVGLVVHNIYLVSLNEAVSTRLAYVAENMAAILDDFGRKFMYNTMFGLVPYLIILHYLRSVVRFVDYVVFAIAFSIAIFTYDFHRTLSILTFPTLISLVLKAKDEKNIVKPSIFLYILPLLIVSGYGLDYYKILRMIFT